jgi:hypothetical protein
MSDISAANSQLHNNHLTKYVNILGLNSVSRTSNECTCVCDVYKGVTITQEIDSWCLVEEARVQYQGSLCRFYSGHSGNGSVFLLVLRLSIGSNQTIHFPFPRLSFGVGAVCPL